MTKRAVLWAFTFIWLLGPIEPVFAFDRDIAGQFPDVVTSPAGGKIWAVETPPQSLPARNNFGGNSMAQGSNEPWTVEMWSRGRRRYKNFNGGIGANGGNSAYGANAGYGGNAGFGGNGGGNFNANNNGYPDLSGVPRGFRRQRRYHADNNYGASNKFSSGSGQSGWASNSTYVPRTFNYNDVAASPQQYFPDRDIQSGQQVRLAPPTPPSAAFSGSVQRSSGNSLINAPDPSLPRRPDKFADAPQVDQSGVRHFGNGRHHDLKTVGMEQALADTETADAQIQQQQQQDQMLKRMQAHRRFNQFGMFNRF